TGTLSGSADMQEADLRAQVIAMADTLRHRGPDDKGDWVDAQCGVSLGHRRLSILDLSEHGKQPMVSPSGRFVIAYNGEVYNCTDLQQELIAKGYAFRGHSDTEVMLAAFEAWGLQASVARFVGMFAFALWDRQERCLHLVRDRVGIKPLYYSFCGRTLLFASELKAFARFGGWRPEIDRTSLGLLMRHNYIPAPHCIYQNTYKLLPGCILSLRAHEIGKSFSPWPVSGGDCLAPVAYWSARRVHETAQDNPFTGSEREAIDILEAHLQQAVHCRMLADVPLGAFLSGGIDSSMVVALMAKKAAVKTFSIGFVTAGYDEAPYAKAVAQHLGTQHTEQYVTPEEGLAVVPKLPELRPTLL
ncbi:MAG: asparagine synthase (glutamine-hydrolyzing), partial [Myxococcota bacterium]